MELTSEQIAEVERARQEAREGRFATEEEMMDVWRRSAFVTHFHPDRGCGEKQRPSNK